MKKKRGDVIGTAKRDIDKYIEVIVNCDGKVLSSPDIDFNEKGKKWIEDKLKDGKLVSYL